MAITLTSEACRVLGSLMEKEITVPATYPMTLNAVVTACNQSSGRNPVMHLTDRDVQAALDDLRALGLARVVHASHGARTVKYRQVAHELLELDPAARAVVTVLLLRGQQTPGELRSRTERLHTFGSADEVDATLADLAARPEPLAVEHPRRPGQKEQRWSHLLGPPTDDQAEPAAGPTPASIAPAEPAPIPAEVAPLARYVGVWKGNGQGHYPTIEPFGYAEEIEFRPVPGKPFLAYRSSTRHADDGRPLHAETGWLRLVGPDSVELVVAQGPGIVEVSEGPLVDDELLLVSTLVGGSTTAVHVVGTERHYRVQGDQLSYDISMAIPSVPLTHHLRATLTRT